MSEEDIKPGTGELDLNQDKGDGHSDSEVDSILSELDEETQAKVLEAVNKGSKKDFKDVKSLVKSLKDADRLAAELGKLKQGNGTVEKPADKQPTPDGGAKGEGEAPKVSATSPAIERIFFNQEPDAKHVWEEVKRVAKLNNKDPFELYSEDTYFQEKAKALAESAKRREEAKGKVTTPSGKIGKDANFDWTKLTPEQVSDLSLADFEKYSEAMAAQSRANR